MASRRSTPRPLVCLMSPLSLPRPQPPSPHLQSTPQQIQGEKITPKQLQAQSLIPSLSGCGTTANLERSCQPPRSRSSRTLTASPARPLPTTAQGQGWARRTPRCPGGGRGRRVGHFQITRGGQHLQKHHVLLTGAAATHIFFVRYELFRGHA